MKIRLGVLKQLIREATSKDPIKFRGKKLTRDSIEQSFPGALDAWEFDEDGFSKDSIGTVMSIQNGKLYSEPDDPSTPWVWDAELHEWHQVDESGYEEYD